MRSKSTAVSFILFLLMWLPALPQQRAVFDGTLVVSNNGENQVLLVGAQNFETLAALPVGVNPHDITVSPDGRIAYVAIMGTRDAPGNSIAVIDLVTRSVKGEIDLGKNNSCHDVRVSRSGRLLWTTCAPSRTVLEIDTGTGKILRTWPLTDDGAWMLVVTPDEKKIYTANLEGKSISVIDRGSNIVRNIKFDSGHIGLDLSPSGRKLWVHHIDKNAISVIDTRSDKVIATFSSSGRGAGRLKFTPNGKYVVLAQTVTKNAVVFDAATRRVVADIPLSSEPKVVTISGDGKHAYITSPPASSILTIDLTSFKEINAEPVGKNTDGIAWSRLSPSKP